jgi:hypothetical protein
MKKVCGLKYFHHPYSFPRSSPPSWAEKVDRWHQLDAYSFGLIDAYAHLQDRLEAPEFILLASPSASNDADQAFVLSKAKSPAKMVHTLPNVRSSSLVKFMGWGGPVLCLQKDPQTLLTAIVEGLDLIDPSCRNLMIWGVVNQALFHGIPELDGPPLYETHVFSLTYLASEERSNKGFPYIIQRGGDDPSLTCPNDGLLVEWLSKPFSRGDLTISPQITLSPN